MIPQNKSEFDKLNITYWWSKGFTGKGVNLVVLDVTGKPFEKDNIINPLQHLETHDKNYGHKSYVCGIIREILPDATIYAMRFNSAYQDECIDWILENKEIIDGVNISLSGTKSTNQALLRLKETGIPIFIAMGNESEDKPSPTAEIPMGTKWGAWEDYRNKLAHYSNYGQFLDFVTYTNIYVTTTSRDKIYMFNGTSCSAPVAMATYGLYAELYKRTHNKPMTQLQAFEFMLKNVDDKETPGRDDLSGYGLFRLPKEIPTIEGGDTMKFKDTNGHWADGAIDFVSDKGLLKGYEDGTFKPERAVTRAELATVLARQNGYVEKK